MILSECCDAQPWGGMEEHGICGDCKEHCEFYDDEKRDDHAFERVTRDAMREFSPEQQAYIEQRVWEAANTCHECGQRVARFSDGATLHHATDDGRIDTEADLDHEPWLQADRQ